MSEKDFLRLYIDLYRKNGEKIPSMKVAKHRIDSIWEVLIETLLLVDRKVIFKGIGKFELKESKPRKIVLPLKIKGESGYLSENKIIPSKKIIRFFPGENFKKIFNDKESENNE